jgi:hypothetical protein
LFDLIVGLLFGLIVDFDCNQGCVPSHQPQKYVQQEFSCDFALVAAICPIFCLKKNEERKKKHEKRKKQRLRSVRVSK